MKNKRILAVVLFVCVLFTLCFASCDNSGESTNPTTTTKAGEVVDANKENKPDTEGPSDVIIIDDDEFEDLTTTEEDDDEPVVNVKTTKKTTKVVAVKTTEKTTKKPVKTTTTKKGSTPDNTGYSDAEGIWSPRY